MNDTRLWNIYQAINEWVRFADAKAGVALAAHGAVFTIGVPAVIENREYFLEDNLMVWGVVIATLVALVSVFFGLKTIIPRLTIGEARSLVFFAHIAEAYSTTDAFRDHSRKHYADDDSFSDQVLDQIWANSRVAWAKHKNSAYCLWGIAVESGIAVALFLYALFAT